MPKKGDPGRGRSKEARTLLRLVGDAGGEVELTGAGTYKVTGPGGVAYVSANPGEGRVWRQTLRTVERETGLMLR